MKPREVRAMRLQQEQQRAARGERLEEYVRDGNDPRKVVPELIPGEPDLVEARKVLAKVLRMAERSPRGARRMKLLDEAAQAMARLVFIERVLEIDRLERAGLTPARLVGISRSVTSEVLRERLAAHVAAQNRRAA